LFLTPSDFRGLIVALGLGFAEELLFRAGCWMNCNEITVPCGTLGGCAVYAVLHFIKPPDSSHCNFPGLLLLGLTFVWAKRSRRSRLGLPIGLHAGLVWGYYIINVGSWWNILVKFLTGYWLTQLIAGIMGCCF